MKTKSEIFDDIQAKFKALDETLWERKVDWPHVEQWLSQFQSAQDLRDDEQVQMLFLASHFMYFGMREVRALLRALFRDIYKYKCIENIRRLNSDTLDHTFINQRFAEMLSETRFLGVGNPSESGSHLLYYFRQENRLGKEYFLASHDIFDKVGWWRVSINKIRNKNISHYVFIDDLCGSGTQATQYSESIVKPLKRLKKDVRVSYYTLFSTTKGLEEVRGLGWFDDVETVVELDNSFKCFSDESRIYKNEAPPYDKLRARDICYRYGNMLEPGFPLGWREGQLLIGFSHNTPDNTLPVIWYDEPEGATWSPLFRRYPKKYGWES